MPINAATGQAYAADGRKAVIRAIDSALEKLPQGSPPALVFLFASPEYGVADLLQGVNARLRNVPVFGFTTTGQLTGRGRQTRTVTVALLTGHELFIKSGWWDGFAMDSPTAVRRMLDDLQFHVPNIDQLILFAADGVNGDGPELCAQLPQGEYLAVGGFTGDWLSGSTQRDRTRLGQFGGQQGGLGGLAAVVIAGLLRTGVGVCHGWNPVGMYFQITRSEDFWVRELDSKSPTEVYADVFGKTPRDWLYPPLSDLIRLYPLGIEVTPGTVEGMQLRAPLRVEADGSFRMSAPIPEGSVGHLLVGSPTDCLEAVKQAAQDALEMLEGAHPVLALVLADAAWQHLLEAHPLSEADAVKQVLGEIPVIGGYTIGQVVSQSGPTQLLNQHAAVLVFGEE